MSICHDELVIPETASRLRLPQVVAHRGASSQYPEHTLAAYRAAIAQGAEALECDVRLTLDGELVCLHDRTLRRTGLRDGLVSTSTLADLEAIDFGAWKPQDEATWSRDEVGVLTMRTLLETAAASGVKLAIETKHPTRYGEKVEQTLVELLADFGWTGADSPVRVMSFSWVALRRIRKLAPALDVVYLMDRPYQWWRVQPVADPDWIAGPGIKVIKRYPELAARFAAAGTRVHVWTV
ncbi:MAG TPA: glycerophosphodiester phosphodiesterase family protein, partial [Marmoricola sp.]|nr:glycerophosphodiester phosphodiesterase family protein [Marmoricola sp.]